MATKKITPGREGYKILFDKNTVIMNYKFAAAAAKYGTRENVLLKNIRIDFPGMTEVVVSGVAVTTAACTGRSTPCADLLSDPAMWGVAQQITTADARTAVAILIDVLSFLFIKIPPFRPCGL